jgi:hypothetical protein
MPFGDALLSTTAATQTTNRIFLSFPEQPIHIRVLDTDAQAFVYMAYSLPVTVNGTKTRRMIPVTSLDNPIAARMRNLSPSDPNYARVQRRMAFNVLVRPRDEHDTIQQEVKIVDAGPSLVSAIAMYDGKVRNPDRSDLFSEFLTINDFDIMVHRTGTGLQTRWVVVPVLTPFGRQPIPASVYDQRKDPRQVITFFTNEQIERLLDGADYATVLAEIRKK